MEPLSKVRQSKTIILKRFLYFSASKFLLETVQFDTRSITGSNLRNILLNTNKTDVSDFCPEDALQIKYHLFPHEEHT